jgi:hypothetical protein
VHHPSRPAPRLRRAAALTAIAGLALPATAGAALGTAKPGTGDRRPNLVSVTVSGSQAVYRFDRALESGVALTPADFTLVTNAGGPRTASSATVNGSAVRAAFSGDLARMTAGTVAGNAVTTDNQTANDFRNLPDAAPVTTSPSKDGTRGVSSAPRLISVRREGLDGLVYVFDRSITAPAGAGSFRVADAGGDELPATGLSGSASGEVRTQFPPGILDNAVSAFVADGAVTASAPNGPGTASTLATIGRAPLPGRTGTRTARADLVSTDLVSASFGFGQGTVVRYVFDQSVVSSLDATRFGLVLANGRRIAAVAGDATANPDDPRVVDVTFRNAVGVQEYAVAATVDEAAFAVSGRPAATSVARDIASLGANEGASAVGWTVTPEVLAVAKTDSNELRVTIDTRLTGAPGPVTLLDAAGQPIGSPLVPAASSAFQGQPGAKTLVYDVPGGAQALAAARTVVFPAGTFPGALGASLSQVVGL